MPAPKEKRFLFGKNMIGWVKIYRKILSNKIWSDKEPFDRRSAFIDLLLTASFQDTEIEFDGHKIKVKAGQKITSIRSLAKRWNWTEKKVRVYLDFLEKNDIIERQTDSKKTTVTIKNYSAYQGHTEGHRQGHTQGHTESRIKSSKIKGQGHSEGHTEGHRQGQHIKNIKELKNNIYSKQVYDFEKLQKFVEDN